jgi:hypothetical protein
MVSITGMVHADVLLESDAIVVTIDDAGRVAGLTDKADQVEDAAAGQESPLLMVYRDGAFHSPQAASWNVESRQITLRYADAQVVVSFRICPCPPFRAKPLSDPESLCSSPSAHGFDGEPDTGRS